MDIRNADVAAARAAIARDRDVVIGIKARLSNNVAGSGDLEALRRAQEAAAPFNLPVMIHMGQTVSPLPRILELLKRRDVVTHLYAPAPNGILDDNGRLLPEIGVARRRDVWFDFGNGRAGHVTWDVAERAVKQGFLPDTLSTDFTLEGRPTQFIDLPNVMSKFLLLGVPLDQVIARVTINAARVFEAFKDRGTFSIGAPPMWRCSSCGKASSSSSTTMMASAPVRSASSRSRPSSAASGRRRGRSGDETRSRFVVS
jgi:dihydroorotase